MERNVARRVDRSWFALSLSLIRSFRSFFFYSDEVCVGGLELSRAPAAADAVAEAAVVLVLAGEEAEEAEDLAQDVREGVLEVPVGHDVDERVEGRVEVADPEEDVDDDVWGRGVMRISCSLFAHISIITHLVQIFIAQICQKQLKDKLRDHAL